MNIFLCGQKAFGAAVLKLCIDKGLNIVGVSSPRKNSRGDRTDMTAQLAARHGIPWQKAGELNADTLPGDVDLIVAAHSFDFIGAATRRKTRLGAIGYHPSLLPVHRGRDAVRWAVHMGDKITGGTIYWLSDNMDGGDIAAQRHVFIRPGESASELWRRALFPLGVELFGAVLDDIVGGTLVMIPQDNTCATWEPSIDRQPVFRPDLPRIGAIPGYTVKTSNSGGHYV